MTVFDWAVLALVLISGVLAMYRGFTREMLSILSWVVAGAAGAYVGYTQKALARDLVKNFSATESEQITALGQAAIGIVVFLLVLIVVHFLTMRLSDKVLDSHVGIVDRLLGFMFGVVRGLLVVGILFSGYDRFIEGGSTQGVHAEFAGTLGPVLRVDASNAQRSPLLRVLEGAPANWSNAYRCKTNTLQLTRQGSNLAISGNFSDCEPATSKLSGTLTAASCPEKDAADATGSQLEASGKKTALVTCRQRQTDPYEWTNSLSWLNNSILLNPVIRTATIVSGLLDRVSEKLEKPNPTQ